MKPKWNCFLLTVLFTGAFLTSPVREAQAQALQLDSSADMAVDLAAKIDRAIRAQGLPRGRYRVAVFPFGDADNRVRAALGAESLTIQGELIFHLRKKSAGTYHVLDHQELADAFRTQAVDPVGINPGNPAVTSRVLKQVAINAAVLGALQTTSTQFEIDPPVRVEALVTLIFDNGRFNQQHRGEFDSLAVPGSGISQPSGRFRVDVVAGGQKLNLQVGRTSQRQPRSRKVFFVEVPSSSRGRPFELQITNEKSPVVGVRNQDSQKEAERGFGVAVRVNGVNSIYQEQGNGQQGPVGRHPVECVKWALRDQPLRITGFQNHQRQTVPFQLTSGREGLAETVGISSDLGLVELSFFAESLPGDVPRPQIAMASPVRTPGGNQQMMRLHPTPVETWQIYYRSTPQGRPQVGRLGNQPLRGPSSVDCVLIFDTNDQELSQVCQADRDRMVQVLQGWKNRITDGLKKRQLPVHGELITWKVLQGNQVNATQIFQAIDQAAAQGNQALLVWYTGHGEVRVGSRTEHILTLSTRDAQGRRQQILRSELFARMRRRNAPLTVLLTDSCSPIVRKEPPRPSAAPRGVKGEQLVQAPPRLDVLSDLFFRHVGEVDINSSTQRQLAIGVSSSAQEGGGALLLMGWQALAGSIVGDPLDTNKDRFVSWNELVVSLSQEIKRRHKQLVPESQEPQEPQARALSVRLVDGYPPMVSP